MAARDRPRAAIRTASVMALPGSDVLAARHRVVRTRLTACLVWMAWSSPIPPRQVPADHPGSAGTLVLTDTDVHLLVDFRYQESVRRETQASAAACPGVHIWPVPASYDEALIEMLSSPGMPAKLGIEAAHLTVARKEWLERTSTSRGLTVSWISTERVVEQVRLVKDGSEVAALREAAARLSGVADSAFRAIRAGVTERDVAGAIETAMRSAGYERMAFDTIVASGPNAALPHYRAGTRILQPGDLVVLDFGGVLDGYCSDLTRTVWVGAPTPDALRLHAAVRDAQRTAIEAVKPGSALDMGRCGRPKPARIPGAWRGIRPRDRSRHRAGRPRRTTDRPTSFTLSFRATGTRHGVYH